jgi:inosose dehydratase
MTAITRRRFIQGAAATALAAPVANRIAQAAETKLHVACNQFCWINMYRRQGKDFNADLDAGLAEVKRSGMDGLEAMLGDPPGAERMVRLLKKHGLAMRSFYTGATLHDSAATDASIERAVATAAKAKKLIGLQIVVVNPTPLRGETKSDAQLATQAEAMTKLGGRLAELGTTLAYHFHSPAWQNDGREFHHVMTQTDPKFVQLCLDTHWVYRGSGNNAERVYEVVRRYGKRVAELHIRQSKDGVWTECLTDGDIDYAKVAVGLKAQGVKPLLVLEQAVEQATPNTMDAVESHRRSRAYVEKMFATLFDA